MGLSTAMYTGLSGMNVNQSRIQTIGDNIANVNTTAFKSSRMLFQTQFSEVRSMGTAPSATTGGVNPIQIGLGALVGSTQKDFSVGSIEATGIPGDMAIEGQGFFVVSTPAGRQLYTRDGSFRLDAANQLVDMNGNFVRGFGVDSNGTVIPTALTNLTVPLGTVTEARATANVVLDGDLSAAGSIATQGSTHLTQVLVDGSGNLATASTPLTDLRSQSDPGVLLFNSGTLITMSGLARGERDVPTQQFTVGTTGATLGDFANWVQNAIGINTTAGVPGTPGVTVANGQLVFQSNAGEPNGLSITANNFTTDNAAAPLPFTFTQTQTADGSGVFTAYTVYDSLGTPVIVNTTFTLEALTPTGPVWRFYAEAPDAAGGIQILGTGLVSFDTQGRFISVTGNTLNIDRGGSGAASPLQVTLDMSGIHGLSTELSNVIMAEQDGYPPGTLNGWGVSTDGMLVGTFSNGLSRPLGQVALAMFPNPEGLLAEADNLYTTGPNSGNPTITPPEQFGAGSILGGSLELSNVDLAREFIGLITSSTGFQASSRVISTSSDLLDQLMLIIR